MSSSKLDEIFDRYLPNRTATKEQIKSLFLDTIDHTQTLTMQNYGDLELTGKYIKVDKLKAKIKEL